jgi:hypothetical protein
LWKSLPASSCQVEGKALLDPLIWSLWYLLIPENGWGENEKWCLLLSTIILW